MLSDEEYKASREHEFFTRGILEMMQGIPGIDAQTASIISMKDQVQTIDTAAHAYEGYKMGPGVIPDFMKNFLASMHTSAEQYRQEKVRTLRAMCETLRTDTFIVMARALFEQNALQRKEAMIVHVTGLSQRLSEALRSTDEDRKLNEKALTPSMANPNFAAQLKEL